MQDTSSGVTVDMSTDSGSFSRVSTLNACNTIQSNIGQDDKKYLCKTGNILKLSKGDFQFDKALDNIQTPIIAGQIHGKI